jgi:Lrp/AsnC family leucine-responsive transcriptional regulator
MDTPPAPGLDRIDRAILHELARNARISMVELGERVGLSKTPVTARVRRLEAEGVITGYRAELSARRLGLEHVAFLEVRLSDTREQSLQAFNVAVRQILEVEECHLIAGGFGQRRQGRRLVAPLVPVPPLVEVDHSRHP